MRRCGGGGWRCRCTDAKMIKVDHSASPARALFNMKFGVRWIYFVLNEYGEIVSWVYVSNVSNENIERLAKIVAERFGRNGWPAPRVCYSDNLCCQIGGGHCPWRFQFGHVFSSRFFPFPEELRGQFGQGPPLLRGVHSGVVSLLACDYPEDLARLRSAYQECFGYSAEEAAAKISRDDRRKFCRYFIPAPEQAVQLVQKVFEKYIDCKDPHTGRQLITTNATKTHLNQLEHVRKGCLSDPTGVEMYTPAKPKTMSGPRGKVQLPAWRASRGTSHNENL